MQEEVGGKAIIKAERKRRGFELGWGIVGQSCSWLEVV